MLILLYSQAAVGADPLTASLLSLGPVALLSAVCWGAAWLLAGEPSSGKQRNALQVARARVAAAEKDLEAAQAAADKAWLPFQRAIDDFELKRPRE